MPLQELGTQAQRAPTSAIAKRCGWACTARLVVALLCVVAGVFAVDVAAGRLAPALRLPGTLSFALVCALLAMRRWRCTVPDNAAALDDLASLAMLQPLMHHSVLQMGGWAMEARSLLRIIGWAQRREVNDIVECGSGASTIMLGRMLKQQGKGRLVSFEQDRRWFEQTAWILQRECLTEHVHLIHAPLAEFSRSGRRVPWYDTASVAAALEGIRRVDLLIVDGPVMTETYSRWPALPFFWPWLSEQSAIVLDDVNRAAEAAVLASWQADYELEVEVDPTSKHGQAWIRMARAATGR